ncbi:hypothetical protein LOCC1_G007345 [Lachnellula occidentalis]|uniref:Uncharacterized protein n=1 Tax=Lachnellula occidentalis TaxID=215460 RepID=A0A8H8RU54_9HELO|nr:hypothetical protein LOCC1_G007345 [Lachnellula occidentalis]
MTISVAFVSLEHHCETLGIGDPAKFEVDTEDGQAGISVSGAVALKAASIDKRAKLVVANRVSQLKGNGRFYIPLIDDDGENPAGFNFGVAKTEGAKIVLAAKKLGMEGLAPHHVNRTTVQSGATLPSKSPNGTTDMVPSSASTPTRSTSTLGFYESIYADGQDIDKLGYAEYQFATPGTVFGTAAHGLHRQRKTVLLPFFSKKEVLEQASQIQDQVMKTQERLQEYMDKDKILKIFVICLKHSFDQGVRVFGLARFRQSVYGQL